MTLQQEPSSSFPAAGALVLGVPVLLLALDGAVGCVPAAVVHGLLLTVVALGEKSEVQYTRNWLTKTFEVVILNIFLAQP